MATEQLLLRLPDDLVQRFKRTVPARARSAYVRALLACVSMTSWHGQVCQW